MKKTYISPLTEVVKINAEQMICDSQISQGGPFSGTAGDIQSKDDFEDYEEDLW